MSDRQKSLPANPALRTLKRERAPSAIVFACFTHALRLRQTLMGWAFSDLDSLRVDPQHPLQLLKKRVASGSAPAEVEKIAE